MIGGVLKEKRLAQGVTLERVAADLKIKTSLLKALEEEDFNVFPADVYTMGYLRSYALYLGLAPEPLIEEFKSLRKKGHEPLTGTTITESATITVSTSMLKEQGGSKAGSTLKIIKPGFLILAVLFIIAGMVFSSVFKTKTVSPPLKEKKQIGLPAPPSQPSQAISAETSPSLPADKSSQGGTPAQSHVPQPPAQKETPSSPVAKVTVQQESPTVKAASSSGATAEEPYTLRITAHELTWLKVESEEGIHDITMKPGDSVKYTSRKGFKLIIGNAGGIKLALNEKEIDTPGKPGEVKIINLP